MKSPKMILISAIVLLLAAAANAATWTVTKAANSNDGACDADCSLREAVAAADSGDLVVFNSNLIGQTFTLGGNEIVITKRITIDGTIDSVNVAFLSGSGTSRIFSIAPGGGLDLRNMILVQGNGSGSVNSGVGGAIYAQTGTVLSMERVALRANTAPDTAGAFFADNASVHLVNMSVTGNLSSGCAAFAVDDSLLNISNVTISNNRDTNIGDGNINGAMCVRNSDVAIRNATIANNVSDNGTLVVISTGDISSPATLSIGNTIVAANSMQTGGDVTRIVSSFNTITSVGGNLVGTTANVPAGTFSQANDSLGLNPLLAPTNSLQGGHPVDTHPLQAGSPALNTGLNANAVDPLSGMPLTQDARGIAFPRIAGSTVDKGAFEDQSNGSSLVVTKLTNSNDFVCDLDCSLREAVSAAGSDPGTDNITMAANVFGTMTLGGTPISIQNDNDVNIIGYPAVGAETLVISGSGNTRMFEIAANSNVSMTGLTLADGNGAGNSNQGEGGAMFVFLGATISLDGVIVRNNNTFRYGAIYLQDGVHRIINSTINNNSSTDVCSAVGVEAGAVHMANTTISTNFDTQGSSGLGALCVNGATASIRNSTIAFNRTTAGPGSGIWLATGTLNIGNTIVGSNLAASNPDIHVTGNSTITSVGGNLVQNTNGFPPGTFNQPGDQTGVDPLLMPLADNGGKVTTHMLSPGSPAINSGLNANAVDPFDNSPLLTDARGSGFARIISIVDKGAFESSVPTAAGVSVSGRVLTADGRGIRNARVTLDDLEGNSRTVLTGPFGHYRFDQVAVGASYTVTVSAKRFEFAEPSVLISVKDHLTDVDFHAAGLASSMDAKTAR